MILLRSLDKIKPVLKIVDIMPDKPFKKTGNCNGVIDDGKKSKYQIVYIGGGDIREWNKRYILAIVL